MRNFSPVTVGDLRGSWTRARTEPGGSRAQTTVRAGRASNAVNVRYDGGRVIGRDGFSPGAAASGAVTHIQQWQAQNLNETVTFENGGLRLRNFTGTVDSVSIPGAYSCAMVEIGPRAYFAFYNSALQAASEVRIVHPTIAGSPADKAFMGPVGLLVTAAEAGAGVCTEGAHDFGFVVESRSGFQGRMSPVSGAIFTPITFTVTSDKTVRLTIDGVWPADAAYVRPVMTTRENRLKFFQVPGVEVAIPGGSSFSVQLDISISDEDLEARGTEMTDAQNYLVQNGGVGPIQPFNIRALSTRMTYFTGESVYASDPLDYEVISNDQHRIPIPMDRLMVTACHIRGVNYLFGPKWTYAVVDNSDVPATWSTPWSVSEGLGTTAIHGVQVSTKGDYAWVANEEGLWYFGGQYDDNPISFMNHPEWKRINWASARATLRIVDHPDPESARVMVFVPLDGATQNTHRLTWHYARGKGPFEVDFSLDTIAGASFGGAALVQDQATQITRLWVGPAAAGLILIESRDWLDDNTFPIPSTYESGRIFERRQVSVGVDQRIQGIEVDVKGQGMLGARLYNLGRTETVELDIKQDGTDLTMEELPTDHMELPGYLKSPDCTVEFRTERAIERMEIANFTVYFSPAMKNR